MEINVNQLRDMIAMVYIVTPSPRLCPPVCILEDLNLLILSLSCLIAIFHPMFGWIILWL